MGTITCAELALHTCGEVKNYSCVGLFLLNLVTDRTSADVANKTSKGIYNATDLNRVETAMDYVADKLTDQGYIMTVTTKTDWAASDIPYDTDMTRYLGNVKKCVDQFCKQSTTPALPVNMDGLNHTRANTIEQTLKDAEMLSQTMILQYRDAGTIEAGE